ncbi:MAG: 23S rRNA (adenine(2503)-C(2))-methyltransferase RlmN, partial [Lachnospirales bacterium]
MKDLKSLTLPELKEELVSIGEKPFRAKQVFNWLHKRHILNIDEMSNISKDLREK